MVPAAAVIPSLTAFSYAVAVETLVASSNDVCHCEESGALTAGSLHRPAQDGRPFFLTEGGTRQRAPRSGRYSPGTGEIG